MPWGPTFGSDPATHCPRCEINWAYCDCAEPVDVIKLRQENEQLKIENDRLKKEGEAK